MLGCHFEVSNINCQDVEQIGSITVLYTFIHKCIDIIQIFYIFKLGNPISQIVATSQRAQIFYIKCPIVL